MDIEGKLSQARSLLDVSWETLLLTWWGLRQNAMISTTSSGKATLIKVVI